MVSVAKKMNDRQKIRAFITIVLLLSSISLAFLDKIDALKNLILPLTIVLGGYFSVETIKNISNDKNKK